MVELQAAGVSLRTSGTHERALELDEPLGKVVSSRQLRLALSVYKLSSAPLVFRARVPRPHGRPPLLRILCRHAPTVSTPLLSGNKFDAEIDCPNTGHLASNAF